LTDALHDLPLEREVLGAVLLRPELLLSMDVAEGDLYSPAHQRIWRELVYLGAEGVPINESTLRARLLDVHQLAAVGGEDYLLSLTDRAIPHTGLPVERLRRLARLRALRGAAQRLATVCETGDLEDAVSALTGLHEASLEGTPRNKPVSVLELCEGLLEDMERPVDPGQLFHPGYQTMREVMGLLPVQTSIGILADTNVGKSTFVLEVLVRMACRNIVCGYVSIEDQRARVRARIAGMLSNVSSRDILQHQLDSQGKGQLARGFSEIDRLKRHLHVSILQGGTADDVCAALSELANRGVRVFAVDYVQKLRSARRSSRDSRVDEISEAMSKIVSHAHRLGGVLFLVSQCKRDKERENQCPSLHDAKGSGDLENELDIVIGLWREYKGDSSPTWARLLKTKDGGRGGSWAMARATNGRLEEIEGSQHMEAPDDRGEWSAGREATGTRRRR
jgi:replicative DNA helicase